MLNLSRGTEFQNNLAMLVMRPGIGLAGNAIGGASRYRATRVKLIAVPSVRIRAQPFLFPEIRNSGHKP